MARYVAYTILVIASIELGLNLAPISVNAFISFGILIVVLLAICWKSPKSRNALLLALVLIMFIGRSNQFQLLNEQLIDSYLNEEITISALIAEDPQEGVGSKQIILDKIRVHDNPQVVWPGKIVTRVQSHQDLAYGDEVELTGVIKNLKSIENVGYQSYLYYHQIYTLIEWPKIKILGHDKGNAIIASGIKAQHLANQNINQLLPRDLASFLSGVVIGAKQPVSESFSNSLKITGTNHLIVASGYNISILIALVIKTKKYLSKYLFLILVLIMIACYTLMSGLDSSIIRASIMASLALIATSLGRQRQAIFFLLMAGTTMLLVNPLWIYDAGYQLSFAATSGIIAMQPFIYNRLLFIPESMREALSTTLAAQAFVYPIIATTFEQVSIIGLLSNLLISWVIPVVMFIGIVVILLSFVALPLAHVVALIIYPVLWYIKSVIIVCSNVPFATLTITGFSWTLVSAYYALIYYIYRLRAAYGIAT